MSWGSDMIDEFGGELLTFTIPGAKTVSAGGRSTEAASSTADVKALVHGIKAGSDSWQALPQGKRHLGGVALYHAVAIPGSDDPPSFTWRGSDYKVVATTRWQDPDAPNDADHDVHMTIAARVK